jgi:hypothetical protein
MSDVFGFSPLIFFVRKIYITRAQPCATRNPVPPIAARVICLLFTAHCSFSCNVFDVLYRSEYVPSAIHLQRASPRIIADLAVSQ